MLFLNKSKFPLRCKIHSSNRVCLINSIDFISLLTQLNDIKVNSLKARKNRVKRLQQPVGLLPANMVETI